VKFDDVKSETPNLRVSPTFKIGLKIAADSEQRSMVNMLEVLLPEHCDAKGIVIREQRAVRRLRSAIRPQVEAIV
jgi:hypothetical protein